MPRKATGNVYWSNGQAFARLKLDKRAHVRLATCSTPEQAEARKEVLAGLAAQLVAAGHGGELGERLLKKAGEAADGKPLEAVRAVVARLIAGQTAPEASASTKEPTFGDVATRWTSGELARLYPDYVKNKKSADSDAH